MPLSVSVFFVGNHFGVRCLILGRTDPIVNAAEFPVTEVFFNRHRAIKSFLVEDPTIVERR